MSTRLLSAIFLSATLFASQAGADTVQMVRDGFRVCAKHAPQVRKSRDELEAIGWISQGIENDLRIFLTKKRDGIAAINSASYDNSGCAFGVKGMSLQQNVKLATGVASALFGKSAKAMSKEEIDDPEMVAGWTGKINGHDAGLAVSKEMNIPNYYRGAVLLLLIGDK